MTFYRMEGTGLSDRAMLDSPAPSQTLKTIKIGPYQYLVGTQLQNAWGLGLSLDIDPA